MINHAVFSLNSKKVSLLQHKRKSQLRPRFILVLGSCKMRFHSSVTGKCPTGGGIFPFTGKNYLKSTAHYSVPAVCTSKSQREPATEGKKKTKPQTLNYTKKYTKPNSMQQK